MNAPLPTGLVLGQPFEGGIAYGIYLHQGHRHLLVKAPKAFGEFRDVAWNASSYRRVDGALSYFDGLANTRAMADAGSELAQRILALDVGGARDWFLPALDQLEPAYRIAKPTAEENWCYARSGINLSALPPTYPYTPDFPKQTELEIFREGAGEAFEPDAYWTSTQYAGNSDCAYVQFFSNGNQGYGRKDGRYMACAVRSVTI